MLERKPMIERVRLGTCRSLVKFRKVSRGFARVLASEKAIRVKKTSSLRVGRGLGSRALRDQQRQYETNPLSILFSTDDVNGGGLSPLYQIGGTKSLPLALKLQF